MSSPKKVVFLTTAFPIANDIAFDYFQSLDKQTYNNFDVLIVNDGFINLQYYKTKFHNLNIIEVCAGESIAENREILIKTALSNGYEYAVFGDFDDCFESNRIEIAVTLLSDRDIVVNELVPFNESGVINGAMFGNRFNNNQDIVLDTILDKNIFGLSNTSVRLNCLNDMEFEFADSLIAVDWFFFSLLLLKKLTACFTNKTITYYRQHQSNIVGSSAISAESIKLSIKVRTAHYNSILKYSNIFERYKIRNDKLSIEVENLEKLESIVNKNIRGLSKPLWWEILE